MEKEFPKSSLKEKIIDAVIEIIKSIINSVLANFSCEYKHENLSLGYNVS